MKERPILFSAPMVRALLAGTKTQTRRICKAAKLHDSGEDYRDDDGWPLFDASVDGAGDIRIGSPYGQAGDRLWVREGYSGPHWMTGVPPRDWIPGTPLWYWADGRIPTHGDWTKPKPGMHMPRWASRIDLEVTSVRVERLQAINEYDAAAEGVATWAPGAPSPDGQTADPSDQFRWLWSSINGADSWSANPWVWVVEFRRIKP